MNRIAALLVPVTLLSSVALAAEKKPATTTGGNDDIDFSATLLMEKAEMQEALGADLGEGYIIVRMKMTPKNKALRMSADDFTLLSRKNGERSPALPPSQIAGGSILVVKPAADQPGGDGTATNGPLWGGVSSRLGGLGKGTAGGNTKGSEAKVDDSGSGKDSPLLPILTAKMLPDAESNKPVEGLLYFVLDGKFKPKELSLIYKGVAGKIVLDFK
jgi:hypothetical protein